MMFKQLVRILRAKCFECHQLRLSRDKVRAPTFIIYLYLLFISYYYLPLRPVTL